MNWEELKKWCEVDIMEISIEVYSDIIYVKVNNRIVWKGTYLEGALETVKKEVVARYCGYDF